MQMTIKSAVMSSNHYMSLTPYSEISLMIEHREFIYSACRATLEKCHAEQWAKIMPQKSSHIRSPPQAPTLGIS